VTARRLPMRAALALRRKPQRFRPWRRDTVLKWAIGIACAAVLAITIARGVARASDWVLLRQLPNQEWVQRGVALDHQVECLDALASDGIAVPAGTKLKCQRVTPIEEAKR
jgi:hypothetical protein